MQADNDDGGDDPLCDRQALLGERGSDRSELQCRVDLDDGTLLRKYVGCSYASGSIDIQKHQIAVQSAQFNALDVVGTAA